MIHSENNLELYQSSDIYPLFEEKINETLILINRRLVNPHITQDEKKYLFNLLNNQEAFKFLIKKKPAISNVNLEAAINSIVKKDPEINVVTVKLELYKNSDPLKHSLININLGK